MNTETPYQFTAIALLGLTMTISIYYRSQANRSGEKISTQGEGKPILYLRSIFGLALWLSSLAYLVNPRWMAWSSLPLPAWARWVGAAIMALCVPLIYWVFSSLGKNVTHTVAIRKEHSLVTHGPYRWVRHPLYTVGFLAFTGLSLLAANYFIFAMLLATYPILMARTAIEEERLVERFGEQYQRYMQRTGRFLPRWRGISL
jgi:protein-S-isoprenylcysteine O-methyltransferase Ste14